MTDPKYDGHPRCPDCGSGDTGYEEQLVAKQRVTYFVCYSCGAEEQLR